MSLIDSETRTADDFSLFTRRAFPPVTVSCPRPGSCMMYARSKTYRKGHTSYVAQKALEGVRISIAWDEIIEQGWGWFRRLGGGRGKSRADWRHPGGSLYTAGRPRIVSMSVRTVYHRFLELSCGTVPAQTSQTSDVTSIYFRDLMNLQYIVPRTQKLADAAQPFCDHASYIRRSGASNIPELCDVRSNSSHR